MEREASGREAGGREASGEGRGDVARDRGTTEVRGHVAAADVLPPGTRLGRVRLQVSELERSVAFYETVLGLRVLETDAERVVLGPVGGPALVELHGRAGARPVPRSGRLGLYHFAVLLPERAALGRFLAHVAGAGVHPGMADHLVSEAIYLSDPDGLGIEVYADRPRSEWRWRAGDPPELVMDTRPLDVRGLLAAAGGRAWTGVPPGTSIGHVHLHVGDLSRAAALYEHALGFTVTVRGYPGALFLSAGGYHHHLGLNTWAAGAPPAEEADARLLDWEIVLPGDVDAAAVAGRVAAGGYAPAALEGGWRVADPWGTAFRLISDTGGSDSR